MYGKLWKQHREPPASLRGLRKREKAWKSESRLSGACLLSFSAIPATVLPVPIFVWSMPLRTETRDALHSLLKQHADVNAAQGDGATALAWAAHWNDLETADLLIAARANVNAANDYGITPLWLACDSGSVLMVEKLLPRPGLESERRSGGGSRKRR